ncbi:glycosyltransferase [Metabacillus bambusae]|uniref:Glycosyltransferase n=1 Tax=Metabacillus bambusae TaxID=2795218 RepID=A0ABS3N0G2_9BACI|nr:glycosyltransferase [Metabacillus bambusae]MBO1511740.1 glycosyltransferase [Metabacillus bambusae]
MTKKLSICMIVKDEEKNLRRCLESLKLLISKDFSELIIVDTGSTDKTMEIAKEYTENVYFHEWNGNFSDMRNISISYATGEWIFIIDADEELNTPNELIDLLESSKINNFKTIRIREKNLLSVKLNKYVYHVQERLFKNDGTFQYKGTIHNQPIYQHPVLTVDNIWLMHYGYINEDKELMEKKFQRTANMLKTELKNDPEHVYYRFQLARSYMMHGDSATAIEEIKKAYKSMKKQDNRLITYRYYVFGEYARMALHTKKFEQVIDVCKEGLSYNDNYLDLYYYMGHAYIELEEYKEGLDTLTKYVELHGQYYKNKLDLSNFTAIEMYTLDKVTLEKTLDRIISLVYKEINIIYDLNQYKPLLNEVENIALKAKLLTKVFILEKSENELLNLYKNIDESQRYPFINYLEMLKKDFDEGQSEHFKHIFSSIEDDYGLLNEIRNTEKRNKLLLQFINNYDIVRFTDEVIIEFVTYLMESKYLNKFFKKLDSVTIKKIVKVLIDKEEKEEYFLGSLRNDYKFNDFQSNRIYIAIANVLLLTTIEDSKKSKRELDKDVHDLYELYVNRGINYIRYLYHVDHLRLIYITLGNNEDRFFILMYLANEANDKGNIRTSIRYYKEALEVYPFMAEFLNNKINQINVGLSKDIIITDINQISSELANKELRVLHGSIEIANQMNSLTKGLQNIGINARSLNYYPSYLNYSNNYRVNISKIKNADEISNLTTEIGLKAIEKFDIFHFHFGTTLISDHSDLRILKDSGKRVYMQHWGSDVMQNSIAEKISKYVVVKNTDEDSIKRKLDFLSKYIKHCIVGVGLYEYVKDFYENVHISRAAIDIDSYAPSISTTKKSKPLIVHAPTSPEHKGTKYILKAIENLKIKYDFDFILVQNMSHEEAKNIYRKADLIVDQILIGAYGLFAVEAMALGKPVITWISEFMKDKYPKELPIISANPENIEKKIEAVLKDKDMREELGFEGRNYVEEYHDMNKIAEVLQNIYINNQ